MKIFVSLANIYIYIYIYIAFIYIYIAFFLNMELYVKVHIHLYINLNIISPMEYNANPLSANFTKWSNTLKQFAGKLPANCVSVFGHFVGLVLEGLRLIWSFKHATCWIVWSIGKSSSAATFSLIWVYNHFQCGSQRRICNPDNWWNFTMDIVQGFTIEIEIALRFYRKVAS